MGGENCHAALEAPGQALHHLGRSPDSRESPAALFLRVSQAPFSQQIKIAHLHFGRRVAGVAAELHFGADALDRDSSDRPSVSQRIPGTQY
jgi:hypothetical protein